MGVFALPTCDGQNQSPLPRLDPVGATGTHEGVYVNRQMHTLPSSSWSYSSRSQHLLGRGGSIDGFSGALPLLLPPALMGSLWHPSCAAAFCQLARSSSTRVLRSLIHKRNHCVCEQVDKWNGGAAKHATASTHPPRAHCARLQPPRVGFQPLAGLHIAFGGRCCCRRD